MRTFLSRFFFLLSFLSLIFGFYLLYLRYSPKKLAFKTPPAAIAETAHKPVGITINSAKIGLPVVLSKIINNNWEVTTKGVSFLETSAEPGKTGNAVFYGHNWTSLLGNLVSVKPGDKLEVLMDNGEKRNFTVEYTAVVSPNQTQIIEQTHDKRVTIYTCTGFLDSKRFVVVAKTI